MSNRNLSLQPMLDVPIYGRIATLELFRPHVRNLKASMFLELSSSVLVFFLSFGNLFWSETGWSTGLSLYRNWKIQILCSSMGFWDCWACYPVCVREQQFFSFGVDLLMPRIVFG